MTENITCNILQINIYRFKLLENILHHEIKKAVFITKKKPRTPNYLYMHLKIKPNSVGIKFLS